MRAHHILIILATAFASTILAQNDDDTSITSSASSESSSSTSSSSLSTSDATETTSSASETSTSDLPAVTSSTTSSTSTGTTSALPTISKTTNSGTYSYPAPTVPPTNNAPYMQKSTMPQGTVFIAVGAILGAFAVAVLVWRAVVACMLTRSVKRAALAQHIANDKATFGAPSTPFYKYSDQQSTGSLGNAVSGRGVRRTQRGPIPSATPSQSNLFFSPTAPGGGSAANRESRFLPSGFYASSAASPQQGQNPAQSISLTNLRPESRGYARALDPSPPESPSLAPPHDIGRRNPSTSTLNLNRPTSGRAPSAYLEDLLAEDPEQFPPTNTSPRRRG
ncbi:hypothetical protein GGR57DRAFT_462010 [Xylariaceae sp. FL1272]|nr:hypothetical protein GGR57DRAFT_462010 [Xylariaceae sp. FL1272]